MDALVILFHASTLSHTLDGPESIVSRTEKSPYSHVLCNDDSCFGSSSSVSSPTNPYPIQYTYNSHLRYTYHSHLAKVVMAPRPSRAKAKRCRGRHFIHQQASPLEPLSRCRRGATRSRVHRSHVCGNVRRATELNNTSQYSFDQKAFSIWCFPGRRPMARCHPPPPRAASSSMMMMG